MMFKNFEERGFWIIKNIKFLSFFELKLANLLKKLICYPQLLLIFNYQKRVLSILEKRSKTTSRGLQVIGNLNINVYLT